MKNSNPASQSLTSKDTPRASGVIWKGFQEFRHDLFKLDVQQMNKNVSYKKFDPKIEKVEHAHFYHSHDMKGKPMLYSASVGGHFHKVDVVHDAQGNIVSASCGPALREVQKKLKNGRMKTFIEKVRYASGEAMAQDEEEADESPQRISFIYDDHTHAVEYKHSEMLSPEKLRARQEQDRGKLQSMIQADPKIAQGTQPKDQEAEGAGDEVDGEALA